MIQFQSMTCYTIHITVLESHTVQTSNQSYYLFSHEADYEEIPIVITLVSYCYQTYNLNSNIINSLRLLFLLQ